MGNTSTTVLADTTGPSTTVFGVTRSPRVGDPFGGRAPCGAARASADVCPDTRTAGVFFVFFVPDTPCADVRTTRCYPRYLVRLESPHFQC